MPRDYGTISRSPSPYPRPVISSNIATNPSTGVSTPVSEATTLSPTPSSHAHDRWTHLIHHLRQEVDPDRATAPMIAYCFMTGFIDVISFTAAYVWCAFQTGNTVQLALALANSFTGPSRTGFTIGDFHALTSILSFLLGAFLGRIPDSPHSPSSRFHLNLGTPKSRLWLTTGTLLQSLCTAISALCVYHSSADTEEGNADNWAGVNGFMAIAFASLSMGLQSIMAKRVGTQFATTTVLTGTLAELMADPLLFRPRLWVTSRDHKFLAILTVFVGALVGRVCVEHVGAAGALAVAAGLRVCIAGWWGWVGAKEKGTGGVV